MEMSEIPAGRRARRPTQKVLEKEKKKPRKPYVRRQRPQVPASSFDPLPGAPEYSAHSTPTPLDVSELGAQRKVDKVDKILAWRRPLQGDTSSSPVHSPVFRAMNAEVGAARRRALGVHKEAAWRLSAPGVNLCTPWHHHEIYHGAPGYFGWACQAAIKLLSCVHRPPPWGGPTFATHAQHQRHT